MRVLGLSDHAIVWSIDHVTVAQFRVVENGWGTFVVHDVSLLAPIGRAIRTVCVTVRLATGEERAATGSS